jgi:hypothetical protein
VPHNGANFGIGTLAEAGSTNHRPLGKEARRIQTGRSACIVVER